MSKRSFGREAAPGRVPRGAAPVPAPPGRTARSLPHALTLTLASAAVWGVAHIWTGRRASGGVLLAVYTFLLMIAATTALLGDENTAATIAADPSLMRALVASLLLLGLLWVAVIVRSYQILRPGTLGPGLRTAGVGAVAVLCFAVAVPVVWTAHRTYLAGDLISSIFQSADRNGQSIDADDPWKDTPRVNVLLIGGDAAGNREGVRTDSMTVASVDTRTGDTVLLSLPRNLERVPLPAGPARDRFPYGFTGDGYGTPGLLNEVYQFAEDHPDLVPGVPKKKRGPDLLKRTVSGILGIPVDHYILVDMFGFADIIDAMGGVRMRVQEPIPYGQRGDVIQPGLRTLGGKEALWYGRSRTFSDDYARMGRQKCLLRAIAQQADPQAVLLQFDKLASATKRAVSTDLPRELLRPMIALSGKVREGATLNSLQFVPPLISTGNPDWREIRRLTAEALAPPKPPTPNRAPLAGSPTAPSAAGTPAPSESPQREEEAGKKPVSLESTCPS
ncbi:LCP family protein [Actinomadura flavalba]|uniref:LCP family protein n=1 Tax=Actinomadura flavalba TaxID=1120938 RepID=UPI000372B2AC|nr:LCP family protein [Actinomadura flavalba]